MKIGDRVRIISRFLDDGAAYHKTGTIVSRALCFDFKIRIDDKSYQSEFDNLIPCDKHELEVIEND